jgi:hypothetical protein
VAIVIQSLVTLVLAATGTFEQLAILANICALALYFGCAVASWQLRARRAGDAGGGIRTPLAAAIPFLACAVIAWLLTGVSWREWLAFFLCVGIASVLYIGARRRSRGATLPTR